MGTIFASHVTSEPLPLPMDPPNWVKVRKLTGHEVELAQAEHARSIASGRGWAERLNDMLLKGPTDAAVLAFLNDPLTGFDRRALARFGLMAWSYGKTVAPKQVDDLDDEALEFIATEVLRLTKPRRFVQTVAESENVTKND